MSMHNPEELLALLEDPDELDKIADQLARNMPPPDLNDPNKAFLPPEFFQAVGGPQGQPQPQPQVQPPPGAPPTPGPGPGAPQLGGQGPSSPASVNFASQLLGLGR